MKALRITMLVLVLVAAATVPVMGQADAGTQVSRGQYELPGYFVCYTDTPWEEWDTGTSTIDYHEVYHWTYDSNGGYHLVYNESARGGGITDRRGDQIEIKWQWHETLHGRVGEEFTRIWPVVAKNLTTGDKQINHYLVRLRWDANGELTVVKNVREIHCITH